MSLGVVDTEQEARDLEAAADYAILTGAVKPEVRRTLEDYGKTVLDRRELDGVRGVAIERKRWRRHVAGSPFAAMPLSRIRPVDVAAFVREVSRKQAADRRTARVLSRRTVQRVLSIVSIVCAEAVQDGLVDSNPCMGVRVRTRGLAETTVDKWTILTPEEQLKVTRCEAIPKAYRLMIRFAIGTGLRQGEQWSLQLSDLHVKGESPHVVVRFGAKGLPPKSGRQRTIPLFGDALEAAKEWLEYLELHWLQGPSKKYRNEEGLVFPTQRGCRRRCGKLVKSDDFGKLMRIAGIKRPVRWHDLRHTCATSLLAGWWGHRWQIEEVRDYLGHSSVTVTEMYAHLVASVLREAARSTGYVQVTGLLKGSVGTGRIPNDSAESHLGDLNPRPAVYESPPKENESGVLPVEVDPNNLRVTPEEVLRLAAAGRGAEALALAVTLLGSLVAPAGALKTST